MSVNRDRKVILITFLVIVALGCFMILPLIAQNSGSPPPETGTASGQAAPDQAAGNPGDAAAPGTTQTGQIGLTPAMVAPVEPPLQVEKPSEFIVKDFPNDEGGVFLIEWPFTANEKSLREAKQPADYKYRILHTMNKADIVDGNIKTIEADEANGTPANYVDLDPLASDTLATIRISFLPRKGDEDVHAHKFEVPQVNILRNGQPINDPNTKSPLQRVDFINEHYFQIVMVKDGFLPEVVGPVQSLKASSNWFHALRINNVLIAFVYCLIVLFFISHAKRGKELFIRKIAGLDAVDEAIGRATEMGRPILYLTGLDSLSTIATIAAVNILGQVAKKVADYDSQIIVPNRDPVVMSVCQEVVKEAYLDAGRPDAYNQDNIFFITDDQFSYVAAIDGIMMREKPATNIFMGYYYAEALILAETGASTGAIQIAGTDSLAQLPFFITTCDYTLIGEELYAASAYLAREPLLLGSLKGQDFGKLFLMIMIFFGVILITISPNLNFIKNIFKAE